MGEPGGAGGDGPPASDHTYSSLSFQPRAQKSEKRRKKANPKRKRKSQQISRAEDAVPSAIEYFQEGQYKRGFRLLATSSRSAKRAFYQVVEELTEAKGSRKSFKNFGKLKYDTDAKSEKVPLPNEDLNVNPLKTEDVHSPTVKHEDMGMETIKTDIETEGGVLIKHLEIKEEA